MVVFFTCSPTDIKAHARFYRAIRDQILSLGHGINRDWIDYSINVAQRGIPDIPSYSVYKDVMSAILTADAIVVEASVRSMSVGHQITYALQKEKPLLLLRHKSKVGKHKKLFIEGSEDENLAVFEYESPKDIEKILSKFFDKIENKSVRRFNLALTGAENNYINWAAFNYKKTKTEIIKRAINKMSEKDPYFKKYLERQS